MINKLAIQSVVILSFFLVNQKAFAENSSDKMGGSPSSNLVTERPITLDNYTGGAEVNSSIQPRIPGQDSVNINTPSKSIEQEKKNYLYGGIDLGINTFFLNGGSRIYTTTAGLQAAGKIGYSMNGPRIELESSIGYLADGAASFTGAGVNAYYDFQTGSTRPYIGVGYGFGSLGAGGSIGAGVILQYKLGLISQESPSHDYYSEIRVVQSPENNRVGIASFNAGSIFKF
jgi:hypothetical protein